jgi:hypothetical protein
MFGTGGIIFVVEGDRNKTDLMPRMFVCFIGTSVG